MDSEDFLLKSYDYHLPEERIAQAPCARPGQSRLLVLPAGCAQPVHSQFCLLPELLPQGALIVANNSRVLKARLFGERGQGKAEFLLLTPLPLIQAHKIKESGQAGGEEAWSAQVECLLKPSAKISVGQTLVFGGGLRARVLEKGEFGRHLASISWKGELEKVFNEAGVLPLPPYIRRQANDADLSRYQTIYAKHTGSVAAPTAGLHFTPKMREALQERGFEWREVTLHVGYGTFSPVRCEDIRQHKMHAEYAEINAETAEAIKRAKRDGRPIAAVGTTSLRVLEGVADLAGEVVPFSGWLDAFFYPGKKFTVADALITNFHLPQSTLLMLASAFAGRKRVLAAYAEAIEKGYNFFSYGDAMLIERDPAAGRQI